MRVPVPWVFVLAYLIGGALELLLPLRLPGGKALHGAGIVLILAGAVLAIVCLTLFRVQRTTTVPFETASRLVTFGPYRLSRNPMYVSLTLMYLGEALFLAQGWPLVLLLLALLYVNGVVIPFEEERLREVFGAEFDAYAARVRRWI